ncbi:MAG: FkbM family methyltransferase [Oscillospiraceae bacterium]|jgi:FkbM family methyltransferase|nr:FkbM family methyltransferase [Oscillospiraceae bacterium]
MNNFSFPDGYNYLHQQHIPFRLIVNSFNNNIKTDNIVIYGVGFGGLCALRQLTELGISVKCFSDSNPKYYGTVICGIPVKSIVEIPKTATILITPEYYSVEIENDLIKSGYKNIYIRDWVVKRHIAIKFYQTALSEKNFIAKQNADKIAFVREKLADEHSKLVFDANLDLWLRGDYKASSKTITPQTYFPKDIIKLTDNEVFVDCGAYTGDSAYEFFRAVDGRYTNIYAYEADELTVEMAKRFCASNGIEKIHIENIGIHSKEDTLNFIDTDTEGNRISDDGNKSIKVNSLDNLLKDYTAPITFVKMDIEGAEMDALIGAKNIISKFLPTLAISAYHKFGDIWEIPYYILKNYPDYTLYLRNNNIFSDFVLFGISK